MAEFTPTETLVLEVLIARHRLGEPFWPLDRNATSTAAVESLARRGLVHKMHGNVEGTFRAALTAKGVAEFMPCDYRAPMLGPLRALIDKTEWDVASWHENWVAASRLLAAVSNPARHDDDDDVESGPSSSPGFVSKLHVGSDASRRLTELNDTAS